MFKSSDNRISIYNAEDKRIRDLYGAKQKAQFHTKLNDQLLVTEKMNDQWLKEGGKLVTGKTVNLTEKQKQKLKQYEETKELHNSIFATHKKIKLGPGEYDSTFDQVKSRSLVATTDTNWRQNEIEEKQKVNQKLIQNFDGSSATIKNNKPVMDIEIFELRQTLPVFGKDVK